MSRNIIILFLMTTILYSCKKDEIAKKVTINGDYFGLLTSTLYVSMTGQTLIDTIDSNLKIGMTYRKSDKTLQLVSSNALFDNIRLNELEITDTINAHYGNDKVFEFTNTGNDWRYYYLHYNKVQGKDSVYIKTYQAPCCGWSMSEIYIAVK